MLHRTKIGLVVTTMILLGVFVFTAGSQESTDSEDACPVIVQSALDTTQEYCNATGGNEACYGHVLLHATPFEDYGSLSFEAPGDTVELAGISSLELSPMDVIEGNWGIARLELRADLPETTSENVTLLVFGDVQLENGATPVARFAAKNAYDGRVNVRLTPSRNALIVDAIEAGEEIEVVGRLEDNSWLRVRVNDTGKTGWIATSLIDTDADMLEIDVVDDFSRPFYQPMQAFYFNSDGSGIDTTGCASLPSSGLLIQTPEGAGEITFLINEVDIRVGSTVFFEAQPGGNMSVTTLEGKARVSVNGVESIAFAGTTVTVPLSEDLKPTDSPSAAAPYDRARFENMPITVLPQVIALIDAPTEAEIAAMNEAQEAVDNAIATGDDSCCNENEGNTTENCGGNSCEAPGQQDKCDERGSSCNAPGQDVADENKGQGQDNNKNKDK